MTLTLLATDNAPTTDAAPPAPVDTRRITESDADYQRLHARTVRKLTASIAQFVRELRRGEQGADSRFIHRHTALLRDAYLAAHEAGQRDYWQSVSLRHDQPTVDPDPLLVQQRLAYFAAGSVLKMAREAQAAKMAAGGHITQADGLLAPIATTDAYSGTLALAGDPDPLSAWQASTEGRVNLQGAIAWSGIQDGYLKGGVGDPANPFALLYWNLGYVKGDHCDDCKRLAFSSPYNAPGSGGNELYQTPGDGRTECGANCKCDLSYAPAGQFEQQATDAVWNRWFNPTNLQAFAASAQLGADLGYNYDANAVASAAEARGITRDSARVSVPPAGEQELTTRQKAALDAYRVAQDDWDNVRGTLLPEAPAFYSRRLDDIVGDELPILEAMTPTQRIALYRLWDALQMWDEATADAEEEARRDAEMAEEVHTALLLGGHEPGYTQNRQKGGKWGPGDGGAHVTSERGAFRRVLAALERSATRDQIGRLAGGGAGDLVHITRHGLIQVLHSRDGSRSEVMVVHGEGDRPHLMNWQHFDAAGKRAIPEARDLARQVRAARELGVERFIVKMAHESNDWVAYPRLGYDAPINAHLVKETRLERWVPELSRHRSILELVSRPEGARWWAENGTSPSLYFDTARGSASVRVLDAVLAAQGEKGIDA